MTKKTVSSHAMIVVWLMAVAISISSVWSVLRSYERPPRATFETFEPKPLRPSEEIERLRGQGRGSAPFAAFVGTSLFLYAIPSTPPTAVLFPDAPDGSYCVRLASGGRVDLDVIGLLRRAVEIGIRKVYVEINPLIEDVVFDPGVAARLHHRRLRMDYDLLQTRLLFDDLIAYAGSLITVALRTNRSNLPSMANDIADTEDLVPVEIENTWLGRQFESGIRADFHKYDMILHPPRQSKEIAAALAVARKKKIDVVFVFMPRPETVVRRSESQYERDYARLLDEFVERFGASVLRADMYWPDDHFLDRAHVNLKGRTRFMNLIRSYEVGRQ